MKACEGVKTYHDQEEKIMPKKKYWESNEWKEEKASLKKKYWALKEWKKDYEEDKKFLEECFQKGKEMMDEENPDYQFDDPALGKELVEIFRTALQAMNSDGHFSNEELEPLSGFKDIINDEDKLYDLMETAEALDAERPMFGSKGEDLVHFAKILNERFGIDIIHERVQDRINEWLNSAELEPDPEKKAQREREEAERRAREARPNAFLEEIDDEPNPDNVPYRPKQDGAENEEQPVKQEVPGKKQEEPKAEPEKQSEIEVPQEAANINQIAEELAKNDFLPDDKPEEKKEKQNDAQAEQKEEPVKQEVPGKKQEEPKAEPEKQSEIEVPQEAANINQVANGLAKNDSMPDDKPEEKKEKQNDAQAEQKEEPKNEPTPTELAIENMKLAAVRENPLIPFKDEEMSRTGKHPDMKQLFGEYLRLKGAVQNNTATDAEKDAFNYINSESKKISKENIFFDKEKSITGRLLDPLMDIKFRAKKIRYELSNAISPEKMSDQWQEIDGYLKKLSEAGPQTNVEECASALHVFFNNNAELRKDKKEFKNSKLIRAEIAALAGQAEKLSNLMGDKLPSASPIRLDQRRTLAEELDEAKAMERVLTDFDGEQKILDHVGKAMQNSKAWAAGQLQNSKIQRLGDTPAAAALKTALQELAAADENAVPMNLADKLLTVSGAASALNLNGLASRAAEHFTAMSGYLGMRDVTKSLKYNRDMIEKGGNYFDPENKQPENGKQAAEKKQDQPQVQDEKKAEVQENKQPENGKQSAEKKQDQPQVQDEKKAEVQENKQPENGKQSAEKKQDQPQVQDEKKAEVQENKQPEPKAPKKPERKKLSPEELEARRKAALEDQVKTIKTAVQSETLGAEQRGSALLNTFGPNGTIPSSEVPDKYYSPEAAAEYGKTELPVPKGLTPEIVALLALSNSMDDSRYDFNRKMTESSSPTDKFDYPAWNRSYILSSLIKVDARCRDFSDIMVDSRKQTKYALEEYEKGNYQPIRKAIKVLAKNVKDYMLDANTDKRLDCPDKEVYKLFMQMEQIPELGFKEEFTESQLAKLHALNAQMESGDRFYKSAQQLMETPPEAGSEERKQLVFDMLMNAGMMRAASADDGAFNKVKKIRDDIFAEFGAQLDPPVSGNRMESKISDLVLDSDLDLRTRFEMSRIHQGFLGALMMPVCPSEHFSAVQGYLAEPNGKEQLTAAYREAIEKSDLYQQLVNETDPQKLALNIEKARTQEFEKYKGVKLDVSKAEHYCAQTPMTDALIKNWKDCFQREFAHEIGPKKMEKALSGLKSHTSNLFHRNSAEIIALREKTELLKRTLKEKGFGAMQDPAVRQMVKDTYQASIQYTLAKRREAGVSEADSTWRPKTPGGKARYEAALAVEAYTKQFLDEKELMREAEMDVKQQEEEQILAAQLREQNKRFGGKGAADTAVQTALQNIKKSYDPKAFMYLPEEQQRQLMEEKIAGFIAVRTVAEASERAEKNGMKISKAQFDSAVKDAVKEVREREDFKELMTGNPVADLVDAANTPGGKGIMIKLAQAQKKIDQQMKLAENEKQAEVNKNAPDRNLQ